MTAHLSETVLEHYLLGEDTLDVAALEEHLLVCEACAAHVRAQLELELQLAEVARAAAFCPGCNRLLTGERCDACGAVRTAGGYRIERVLVRTTHGRVYVAVDGNGQRVALKELAFVQAPTLEALAAFDRETKFLRALAHPAIPRFHASFIEGTGIHTRMYLAQDLVDGESLLARLQTHWFTEPEIVELARNVLDILIYLQGLSPMVFHRDLKPANLIVRLDGSIALVDFGAARDVSETMGNTAVGTFGYMPLEQMAGIYDATTDLFALGATLLHLLTRREPWKLLDGSGAGLNVSPGLRGYLDRLCAPKPQDRFPDARTARHALERIHTAPPRASRSYVRRLAVIGTVAVLTTGAGVALLASSGSDPDAPRVVPIPPTRPTLPPAREVQPRTHVPEPPPPAPRGIEELVGSELVGSLPVVPRRCTTFDRLPSGSYLRECSQQSPSDPVFAGQLADLPLDEAVTLANQLAFARREVAAHPEAGIVVATVEVPAHEGSPLPAGTYRFAAAVRGPLELALHGFEREVITTPANGRLAWLPPVVLRPVARGAVVRGTAAAPTTLRAFILHRTATPSGVRETTSPVPALERTVNGTYELAGFSPGRYRFEVPSVGAITETIEVTLPATGSFDLGSKLAPRGGLAISSAPRAGVAIDGIETGTSTPTMLVLPAGRHKVTFSYGTTRSTFSVIVKANETVVLDKQLE